MPNPKGHIESLGTVPLSAGELSRPVRVRAEAWVLDRLKELSAVEVGNLIADALRARDAAALHVSTLPATAPGEGAPAAPAGASAPSVLPADALHVSAPDLKPLTSKGVELLRLLREGGVMVKDGTRYAVEKDGATVATFAGVTARAVIDRGALLVSIGAGRWTAAPELVS